jgi:ribose 5-phosphate isomerase A
MDQARQKAAEAALAELRAGMVVGLGTGDTASRAIVALGQARLPVIGVATSERSAELARTVGIEVRSPDEVDSIDVTIDGADEIDPQLRLVKGAGGALTREKLVARASRKLVIVADSDKCVSRLGERAPLPVEILSFGARWTMARLASLGLEPKPREGRSDNGGLLVDCVLAASVDVVELARALKQLPGVIEHGLFLDEAQVAYIGGADGRVVRRTR